MAKAPVSADALAADCAALTKSVGIAAKTAGKVATDEHTFDLFVEEQALRLDEGMCTRRQRDDGGVRCVADAAARTRVSRAARGQRAAAGGVGAHDDSQHADRAELG